MASATNSTPLSLSSSSVSAQVPKLAPQCVTLPPFPVVASLDQSSRLSKASAYCKRMARNVTATATTGEAPPAPAPAPVAEATTTTAPEVENSELPAELLKNLQDTWDKIDDKYAVTSLGVAGLVGLWASTGMISAIDRLPLIPGVLELVGIGYTGWFAYNNLVFKPEREALIQKIKDTYKNIIGSS